MKKLIFAFPLLLTLLTACSDKEDNSPEAEWKKSNIEFVTRAEAATENGTKVYTKIVPDWAPSTMVLMKWHNDRRLTADNLVPFSNSTCDLKYEFEDIDGNKLGDSYSSTTYGDSIYRARPDINIIGMWAALTSMHVGDSVTMIIPPDAGYGARDNGIIPANSTLIYHVKLKSIVKYEIP